MRHILPSLLMFIDKCKCILSDLPVCLIVSVNSYLHYPTSLNLFPLSFLRVPFYETKKKKVILEFY